MHDLHTQLYAFAERTAVLALPPVARVLIADPRPSAERDAEFGLLSLSDGAAGLYYAWLGASQADLPVRFAATAFGGQPALALARYVLADDDGQRSLGIAAINAITAHLHTRAAYVPAAAADSFGGLVIEADDRLGMIGNFPPLVRRACALGVPTFVVERKAHMVRATDGLVISLDPAGLRDCTKIICTGATAINGSLDDMLRYCRGARQIALIGPTVGFFPDVAFMRGIDLVAGTQILDADVAAAALQAGNKLGDSARRSLIRREEYPGFARLLERACMLQCEY